MECHEALILISGHIDHQNTPPEEAALHSHLAQCPDCRALLQTYEDIDRNVAALEVPAPEELAPCIMARINASKTKKKRSPWIGIGTSAGLVAAVLVLLIGTNAIKLPKLPDGHTKNQSMTMSSEQEAVPEAVALDGEVMSMHGTAAPDDTKLTAQAPIEELPTDTDAPEKNTFADSFGSSIYRHASVPFRPQTLSSCMTLSENSYAAVLLYSGFDTTFFTWLGDYAPELAERLTKHSEATVDEKTGIITVTSDYTTVTALQEWFRQVLLCESSKFVPEGDLLDEINAQFSLYNLDGTHLETIYTFPEDFSIDTWPENWPEDFSEQWVLGRNWRLFYPEEHYQPDGEDLAFLVLIPPAEEP